MRQKTMMNFDVIVIGGGPAGMMAAITAAQRGRKVVLLDKNKMLGRKLRITGKGRCNITNFCDARELIDNVPTNPSFLYSAFNKFSSYDTIDFFNSIGVKTKVERGMRVFPESNSAKEVADSMVRALHGVKVMSGVGVNSISQHKVVLADKTQLSAESIIIATGGMSYSLTGSTGDGYKFARALGHTVTDIKPSLVPLITKEKWSHELSGLSLKNIAIRIGEHRDFGEMMFAHFGVTGPLILSASAHIPNFKGILYIDLKPALSADELDRRLQRDFEKCINKDFANSLDKLLPKRLIDIIVALSKIDGSTKVHQITKSQRFQLGVLLKNLPLTIVGARPIDEAIITSGGVAVNEINPSTMESKRCKGIYFAGEVIDVDAYTGGFNLQIAFSTGFLAGSNA